MSDLGSRSHDFNCVRDPLYISTRIISLNIYIIIYLKKNIYASHL